MEKRTDLEIIQDIQEVRSKNNVNWMDIIRLAITENPPATKQLLIKINKHDNSIGSLLDELSKN